MGNPIGVGVRVGPPGVGVGVAVGKTALKVRYIGIVAGASPAANVLLTGYPMHCSADVAPVLHPIDPYPEYDPVIVTDMLGLTQSPLVLLIVKLHEYEEVVGMVQTGVTPRAGITTGERVILLRRDISVQVLLLSSTRGPDT